MDEVKPVEIRNKSIFHINCETMHNFFRLKEDNQGNHPSLSHIEPECQESLIQGKIHIQQNSNKGLKYL